MIVHAHEGAGLEVFWRYRGTAPWSYLTALRFLLRFRLDSDGIRSLKRLLAERMPSGIVWRMSHDEVLQRIARLISTGQIILAEDRALERWPGSGTLLASRFHSVLLLCRDDFYIARDMAEATRWIHKLQKTQKKMEDRRKAAKPGTPHSPQEKHEQEAHAIGIRDLRTRLTTATGVPDYAHLNDTSFLGAIEAALLSGRLVPVYHALSGHSEPSPEAAAPPPPASQAGTPDREDPDPNTFDPEHAGVSQAATLTEAAQSGVPFCEVCERAAAERGAA
jgi:hypothetical protein